MLQIARLRALCFSCGRLCRGSPEVAPDDNAQGKKPRRSTGALLLCMQNAIFIHARSAWPLAANPCNVFGPTLILVHVSDLPAGAKRPRPTAEEDEHALVSRRKLFDESGLPAACAPPAVKSGGRVGQFNYNLTSNGAVLEVQLQKRNFYLKLSSGGEKVGGKRSFAWAKHGGPALAWEHVKSILKWDA